MMISVKESKKLNLPVGEKVIRSLIKSGEIPSVLVGGKYLFDPDHVSMYIRMQSEKNCTNHSMLEYIKASEGH